jgi:hypothetical protein
MEICPVEPDADESWFKTHHSELTKVGCRLRMPAMTAQKPLG